MLMVLDSQTGKFDKETPYIPTKVMLEEVVRTVPTSEYAAIFFWKDGLRPYKSYELLRSKKEEEKYLSECERRGIDPSSVGTTIVNNQLGIILNSTISFSEERIRAMIKGYPPNEIYTKLDGSFAFNQFRERFFEEIIGSGYHIGRGEIWLSCREELPHSRLGEFAYHMDGGIMFGSRDDTLSELKLKLTGNQKLDQGYSRWFDNLVEKFRPK